MVNKAPRDKAILMAAFARIDPIAMAVAMGSVGGIMLFTATAVLLLKSMLTNVVPGPHLALIGIYLPGYEISWLGAVLGAAYFCVIGALAGFVLAALWNMTHHLYVAVLVVRATSWKAMAE